MATELGNKEIIIAVSAMAAAAIVSMGTALIYARSNVAQVQEEEKLRARAERRKYRQKYLQTKEGQRHQ